MPQGNFRLTDSEFNSFINEAIPHLNTHQARLGVSGANLANLNNLFGMPGSTGTWMDIWPKSQSPNLRTATITDQKDNLREEITEQLRTIYADIPESELTEEDRNILRIFLRDDVPSERPAIDTAPFVDLKVQDGAKVKVICRVEADANRPSRHQYADYIEVMYVLQNVNSNPPDNPESLPERHSSTGASFTMEFGVENAGRRLFAFFRWANLSDPSKSGPWSQVMTIVVSD